MKKLIQSIIVLSICLSSSLANGLAILAEENDHDKINIVEKEDNDQVNNEELDKTEELDDTTVIEKSEELDNKEEQDIIQDSFTTMLSTEISTFSVDPIVMQSLHVILDNYAKFLVGDAAIIQSNDSDIIGKANAMHNNARTRYNLYVAPTTDSKGIFKTNATSAVVDVTVNDANGNATNLNNTFAWLSQIALGYATYRDTTGTCSVTTGTANCYQDASIPKMIVDGLRFVYDTRYSNEDAGYTGNWFHWEIGHPQSITRIFVLMHDEINALDADLIPDYIAAMDKYLRNGIDGDINLNSRFHTGANLADIAINRILQGALTGDVARVTKAIDHVMTVFNTIDPANIQYGNTDGFYADGSFIQHHRVAYTGAYGKGLLERVVQISTMLKGSNWDVVSKMAPIVKEWIYKGFSPVMFEGWMMEIVKGRAVSRPGTGYVDSITVIGAMVSLLPLLNAEEQVQLKEHIKFIAESSKVKVNAASFAMMDAILTFKEIINDNTIIAKNQIASNGGNTYTFNNMDKNVHIRPNYAFSLSRSSNRISKYEYMSNENKSSWFQGDGAYYLYLAGRDQTSQYGIRFYSTMDYYRYPGTTVPTETRLNIKEWAGQDWYQNPDHALGFISSSESQNDYVYFPVGSNVYSGSVSLGNIAAAGLQLGDDNAYVAKQQGILPDDFVVYKNAEANKSYFMFDDEIVFVGSGIRDTKQREVVTTVDQRMSLTSETTTVMTGNTNDTETTNPTNGTLDIDWLNYKTNIASTSVGYYFPTNKTVDIKNETRNGNSNLTGKTNGAYSAKYTTISMNHGTDPQNEKYSFVVLPNYSVDETRAYAKNPSITILANETNVHAVRQNDLKVDAFNFFANEKTTAGKITSYNQANVILKDNGNGSYTIAVSDPTFKQSQIKLELNDLTTNHVDGSGVTCSNNGGKTQLYFDTNQKYGESLVATFQLSTISSESPDNPTTKPVAPKPTAPKENLTVTEIFELVDSAKDLDSLSAKEIIQIKESLKDLVKKDINFNAFTKVELNALQDIILGLYSEAIVFDNDAANLNYIVLAVLDKLVNGETVVVQATVEPVDAQDVLKAQLQENQELVTVFEFSVIINGEVMTTFPVSLEVEMELDILDGEYILIREHEGTYTQLPAIVKAKKLQFSTDKNSVYGVVKSTTSPVDPTIPKEEKKESNNIVPIIIGIGIVMILGVAGFIIIKNKKED